MTASNTNSLAPITPEMVEEGVRVYLEHCPDTGVGDRLDREMVAEIYEAMAARASARANQ